MARVVNIHEAKTHFSELVEAVEHGEEVIIARRGKRVARLIMVDGLSQPRRIGWAKGQIWYGPDFDKSLEDLFEVLSEEGSEE
jgi:prevent-host-death family protein